MVATAAAIQPARRRCRRRTTAEAKKRATAHLFPGATGPETSSSGAQEVEHRLLDPHLALGLREVQRNRSSAPRTVWPALNRSTTRGST